MYWRLYMSKIKKPFEPDKEEQQEQCTSFIPSDGKRKTIIVYMASDHFFELFTLRATTLSSNGKLESFHEKIASLGNSFPIAQTKAKNLIKGMIDEQNASDSDVCFLTDEDPIHALPFYASAELPAREQEYINVFHNGFMPFGHYAGLPLEEVPADYLRWMRDKPVKANSSEEEFNIAFQYAKMKCKETLAKLHKPSLLFSPEEIESAFLGQVGEEVEDIAELKEVSQKVGRNGEPYYLNKLRMRDKVVVSFGEALGKRGDKLMLRALVKSYNKFRGQCNTIITPMQSALLSRDHLRSTVTKQGHSFVQQY